ncbi:Aste57867_22993 [Aphanomyces stellatus]|uniref:ubiquitinyl hydrolase 1 n=1 Tax=Aphanomyces stellatus TaxID=120398 RepID=A0A485LM85_9STRA|nr:hypothetical protein As57867_022922 [Aphanomyces stellatus]VFT99642.1 Aste57867_22993 [Aphanomyces stellatus]
MEPDSSDSSTSNASHAPPQLKDSDKRRRIQETTSTDTTPPLNPQQIQLYRIVYEDLRKQSTVGWHNAVSSFETAHAHINQAETQEFLQMCFHQILCIMLDQLTSKMAPTEKNCVIRTLTKGTAICLAQIQRQRTSYFAHMALILNKKKLFYKEFRQSHMMNQYWNKTPGCPEVRLQCLSTFHEHHGFAMLAQMLEQALDADKSVALLRVVSMDDLRLLFQGVYDIRAQVEPGWITRLSSALMQLLLVLPAAELKKEPTESIGHVLQLIQRMWDPAAADDADDVAGTPSPQETLLQVVSRFIESTSLPQRLFGFEQLGHLVQHARHTLPLPPSYRITGAGSPNVNGVYELVSTPSSSSAAGTYIKTESRLANASHPMTLFCCTMKSGSKMWFLSEADQMQPGTDQDIDYYHHQAASGEETIPPLTHWVATGRGLAPSPLLIPSNAAPTARIDPRRLDQKVLAFVEAKHVLDEIFGDRIHREIVSRSTALLKFLAETGHISDAGLRQIWLSAAGKEATLVTEIHLLLVSSVLVYVGDAQLASFFSYLLTQPVADVALFMDKVAVHYRCVLHRVDADVTRRCLRLMWTIQKAQSQKDSDLVEFFHDALQSTYGQAERQRFVQECIDALRESARDVDGLTADQEAATTRGLELLKVLLESSSDNSVVDDLNAQYNLVQLLFDELATFVRRQTPESALRHRLDLIHYIHGKSPSLELTQAQVRSMWNVLSRGMYRDLCWMFLRESSVFVQELAPFNVHVCEYIFNDLLCNPQETDVSTLSEHGFACFHTYFVGLNAHHHHLIRSPTGAIRRIVSFEALVGLDALWDIAIHGLPDVSKLAIVEVLNVYMHVDDREKAKSTLHFLQHVFDVLKRSATHVNVVQHCMHLLTGYVNQSPVCSMVLHGKRSRGAPLAIHCTVQRIPTSIMDKIPPFTLHVTANDTLGTVRQLVEAQLRHPLTQTKLLVQGTTLIGDSKTIDEFTQDCTDMSIVLFQSHVTKEVEKLQWTGGDGQEHHLGPMLARNEAYFDVLFALLDQYVADAATHALVRDVIAKVPTQTTLLELVSHPLESAEKLQQWLSHTSSYHKAVYVLEIIDGCLMPVQGLVSPQYVASFVQYGLDQVLHFLFESRVNEEGMAVAIRIVKCCVLDHNQSRMATPQMESLVARLSNLVLRTSSVSPRIVIDALQIMQAISLHVPFHFPDPWPMESTLLHPQEQIRAQWLTTVQTQANVQQLVAPALETLKHTLPVDSVVCSQLFSLVAFLVPDIPPDAMEELEQSLVALFQPTMSAPVLLGALTILQTMCSRNTLSPRARQQILEVVYDKGLFTSGAKCLCTTAETRKAAYGVVAQLATIHPSELHAKLTTLIESTNNTSSWGQECNVVARGPGEHVGLKNQGCSCYMNSFLQQLFMYEPIRQGLLAAEIPLDQYPATPESEMNLQGLVHTNPKGLIGRRIMNEVNNGRSFEAQITGYDPQSKIHLIKYDEGGNEVRLKLWGKEAMNRVTLLPPVMSGDEATVEVLRQVQRTFWYLRESEMRYYNPKALVEACKCLNLEFSVYQQNDASEFCDKLLDRLEIGLGKTPQGTACLQSHLGGKLISQKLPSGCGHRYEREEAFIRLELQIRGKESIEESLAGFVEGELMDGDNKVECELCGEKKAAIRRTCFGALPQLLVLHLKRFDLDYQTFETVKLNNRCSFPLHLNMKPYTKEGLEASSSSDDTDADAAATSDEPEDEEYAYELRGVLVHAGVAQGGHYYSFILDQSVGKWFKYDDEDVSPFDPANIEAECFGGMQKRTSSWNGVNNTMEMEVFSNALMLFYEKVAKPPRATPALATPVQLVQNPMAQQVWAANDLFLRHSYVFDTAFHEFIKDIVASWSTALDWLQLGMKFVLDIVLRSREKKGLNRWLTLFNDAFVACPPFAVWFLQSDLSSFFTECPDPMARQTVVHLLTRAAASQTNDASSLVQLSSHIAEWCVPPLVDEYFTLLHNVANLSPAIREQFQRYQMVSRLIHVLLGSRAWPQLIQAYGPPGETPLECQALIEALGALLGLARKPPEPLLAETNHQNPHAKVVLSSRAQAALSLLFDEYAVDDLLGAKELQKYFRVCGTTVATAKLTAKKIKAILAKWPKLDEAAFLEYYTELACTSTKQVLSDLKAHGFRENLQRQPPVHALEPASVLLQHLPPLCREAIVHEVFIDAALEEDAETVSDLLVRVSLGSAHTSTLLIKSVLTALFQAEVGWKGQPMVDASVVILSQLLGYDESDVSLVELTLIHTSYSLLVAPAERDKMYAHYGAPPALFIYRYITILMDLHKVASVAVWLQDHVQEWVWMYEWLRLESLKPSLGGRVNVLYRDPGKLETLLALGELLRIPFTPEEKSYVVSGAGFEPVNGVYSMQQQSHDGCPVFSLVSPIDQVEYTLFRCEMPSKSHRWYISHAENRQTLGTLSDVDFYYCLCTIHDETPPTDGWKVWNKNPVAAAPTPKVTLHACTINMQDLDATHHGHNFVVPEMDEDQTVEYEDSEEEIRVSNERFQAVHLESPDGHSSGGGTM